MANLFLKTLPKYTNEIDILIYGNFRVVFNALPSTRATASYTFPPRIFPNIED